MRKEILFAVIAGILFGLTVALGIWRANSALTNSSDIAQKIEVEEKEVGNNLTFGINISQPEDNDVITFSPVNIVGLTLPNSWVTISTEDDNFTILSNSSGEFNQEVTLNGGANRIIANAFSNDGTSVSTEIYIVYSTEFANIDQ